MPGFWDQFGQAAQRGIAQGPSVWANIMGQREREAENKRSDTQAQVQSNLRALGLMKPGTDRVSSAAAFSRMPGAEPYANEFGALGAQGPPEPQEMGLPELNAFGKLSRSERPAVLESIRKGNRPLGGLEPFFEAAANEPPPKGEVREFAGALVREDPETGKWETLIPKPEDPDISVQIGSGGNFYYRKDNKTGKATKHAFPDFKPAKTDIVTVKLGGETYDLTPAKQKEVREQAASLSKRMEMLPIFKQSEQLERSYVALKQNLEDLKARGYDASTGGQQIALINQFQRLIDPATVREGDVRLIQSAMSTIEQVGVALSNLTTGQKLDETLASNLGDAADIIIDAFRKTARADVNALLDSQIIEGFHIAHPIAIESVRRAIDSLVGKPLNPEKDEAGMTASPPAGGLTPEERAAKQAELDAINAELGEN